MGRGSPSFFVWTRKSSILGQFTPSTSGHYSLAVTLYDFPYKTKEKLDIWGFAFSTLGFFAILFGINNVSQYGWGSLWVYPAVGIGAALLIMLVATELIIENPVIQFTVFKDYLFTMSVIITSIIQIAMNIGIFLLPLYLQNILGYTALQTGLFLTPAALASSVMMPISGRLFTKIGARPLGLIGLTIVAVTTYYLTFIDLNTTNATIQTLYIFRMLGLSMAMMPLMTAGMNVISAKMMNQASALGNTVRQISISLGLAILTTYMTNQDKSQVFYLDSQVAVNTPQWSLLPQLESKLHWLGVPIRSEQTTALMQIYNWVQARGFISGMDDVFMITTILTVIALVLTIFFSSAKEHALRQSKQQ